MHELFFLFLCDEGANLTFLTVFGQYKIRLILKSKKIFEQPPDNIKYAAIVIGGSFILEGKLERHLFL